jgi:hypothetical protein
MNRRDFIRRSAVLVAVVSTGTLPKSAEKPIPPFVYCPGSRTVHTNPAWKDAPYEIAFLVAYDAPPLVRSSWIPFRFKTEEGARLFMERDCKLRKTKICRNPLARIRKRATV